MDRFSIPRHLDDPELIGFWTLDEFLVMFIPFVWGVIIAVAVDPVYERLQAVLGGRRGFAAVLFTLLMLLVLIWPAGLLATTLV